MKRTIRQPIRLLAAAWWLGGCATDSREDFLPQGAELERGEFVVEDLYRDVNGEKLSGVRCTETERARYCVAVAEREDDYFGEERYTVVTLQGRTDAEPGKRILIGSFSSDEPELISVMVYASSPDVAFGNRMPDYVAARYPKARWDAFVADPAAGDLPRVVPSESIPRAYRRYVMHMILSSTLEIHVLLEEQ